MESESSEPVPDRLLRKSPNCLCHRDLAGCRKYVLEALDFDSNISDADQILAVADVLLAADRRIGNNHRDWCSILKLSREESGNRQLVWSQFEKLVALVNPSKNKFALSKEAFNLVCDAWAVLSNPGKRTQYENEIENEQEPQESLGIGQNAKWSAGNESFWTACPYCYYIYEYEKVYKDCCLRCQNCRKPFHGEVINAPAPEIMVPGKEQYYFCYGLVPLKHYGSMDKDKEASDKKGEENSNGVLEGLDQKVVEISEDDDDEEDNVISLNGCLGSGNQGNNGEICNGGVEGLCKESVKNEGRIGNGLEKQESGRSELRNCEKRLKRMLKAPAGRIMNTKAVASNTNKIIGNRIGDWDSNEIGGPGVVFYEGEDDVLVGLEDNPC